MLDLKIDYQKNRLINKNLPILIKDKGKKPKNQKSNLDIVSKLCKFNITIIFIYSHSQI